MKKEFHRADRNRDGLISMKESKRVVRKLHRRVNSAELIQKFELADVSEKSKRGKYLNLDEFVFFYYSLLHNSVFDVLFAKYASVKSGGGEFMTGEDLKRFVNSEQKKVWDEDNFGRVLDEFEPKRENRIYLSREGFTRYLMFADENAVTDVSKERRVHQNMTHPLSSYWIASSHNT